VRLSEICIERPVLATVISLLITMLGVIALFRLPNRELPDVDPPIVSVITVYSGAAPEVVETSVTEPLEDQLIGIEGVKHLTSLSREQVSSITVEFELGRDVDLAAADVRDRVARARNQIPKDVEEPIVANNPDCPMALLRRPDGTYAAHHRTKGGGRRIGGRRRAAVQELLHDVE